MNSRDLKDLSSQEIAQLLLLNQKLVEAERWVLARGKICLENYLAGGGRLDTTTRNGKEEKQHVIRQDAKLYVKVSLIANPSDKEYREDEDNILCSLHWNVMPEIHLPGHHNGDEYEAHPRHRMLDRIRDRHFERHSSRKGQLSTEPLCYVFHQLCWETLHYDYDALLRIGGVWVGLHLVQQQDFSWEPYLGPAYGQERGHADFSAQEIAKLSELNDWLRQTEDFIVKQSRGSYSAYIRSGGAKQHAHSAELYEDVEIDSTIHCAIGRKHPDYSTEGANVVATLDDSFIEDNGLFDETFRAKNWWESGSRMPDAFRHCWLFHDLYDHHSPGWDKILSIGQIWADVHLIQQRIATWKV